MNHRHALLLTTLAFFALPVSADRYNVPKHAMFQEECGSCHLAYPPQLLDGNSWRAVMNGLSKHFGTDASLDLVRHKAITEFLTQNSRKRETRDTSGRPLLRISETAHFLHEHDEVSASVWQRASIKGPANCAACHHQAAEGNFSEHDIHIPK